MSIILPNLSVLPKTSEYIEAWGGYDHNARAQGNTAYEMKNMGSRDYPLLGTRGKRAMVRRLTKPNGLFAHNALGWVDGTELWYNGERVGIELEDSRKTFVNMGAFVIIFPDKVWLNTYTGDTGSIEQYNETDSTATVTVCSMEGADIVYTAGTTAPDSPENGQHWIDTSTTPYVLKRWSETTQEWASAATCYLKYSATGIGKGIEVDDAVEVSGFDNAALNGSFNVYAAEDDYIVVTGIISSTVTQQTTISVTRTCPDMDYVCEAENRLWGCSSDAHEVYSCVLGNFKNWRRYAGTATDAYALTIGSTGKFTGCCFYGGYVIFFKEHLIHRIAGSRPSNYTLSTTNCKGLKTGCERSLAAIDETLFYMAPDGVAAYQLSIPATVSEEFGTERYTDAVSGAVAGKLYMSARDKDGNPVLFCYDTKTGCWYKEDDTYAEYFSPLDGELYYLNGDRIESVNGTIPELYADEPSAEEDFDSVMQLADIGLSSAANKYVSNVRLRLVVDDGAHVDIFVQYDTERDWKQACHIPAGKRRSVNVPIIPRRCDSMRIRIVGHGDWRIYSLSKSTEAGSEV